MTPWSAIILCDLKLFLAASTQNSGDFESQCAAPNCILELSLAESVNWKLNLAESAERSNRQSPTHNVSPGLSRRSIDRAHKLSSVSTSDSSEM